ncbi:hypothetical protein [Brassicibacter mesophilus]|uniref:hypothetical protein n=1 Tax=Brassicibacter mesophilus TaxID=745119 RepID=UPI003D246A1D
MNDYNRLLEMLANQLDSKNCELHKYTCKSNKGDCLTSLPPQQFTGLATIIGFLIASRLTFDQQNSIGNFIELIGQVILTISAQGSTLQTGDNNNQVYEQLSLIKKQIELIEKQLK